MFADFPLPANFYDLVACTSRTPATPSTTATGPGPQGRGGDRDVRPTRVRLFARGPNRPGVTDQAPLVPVTNDVNWWVTSERVDNYQSG